jgi:hypothetical protein
MHLLISMSGGEAPYLIKIPAFWGYVDDMPWHPTLWIQEAAAHTSYHLE